MHHVSQFPRYRPGPPVPPEEREAQRQALIAWQAGEGKHRSMTKALRMVDEAIAEASVRGRVTGGSGHIITRRERV